MVYYVLALALLLADALSEERTGCLRHGR
jgi:hypothetical protein